MKFLETSTAFILAGGKSSRMGEDKGLVVFNGKEMIVWMLELLIPQFKEVRIITNNVDYTRFNIKIHNDMLINQGPLAGIYTGLTYSSTPWNFFVACDMPFMNIQVIQKLITNGEGFDALVPFQNNRPEPLCAFYNKTCLNVIENQLKINENKIQDFYKHVNIKEVNFDSNIASEQNPFRNINTQEELKNSLL